MKWLKTAKVVAGRTALLGGRGMTSETELLRNRGFERALAVVTGTALVMSLMIALAPPVLAHHPILEVSAICDDQGNKVVTWTVSNGNWEGRTMTLDLVQYTDGTSGWANIVVGLGLGPDASTSETVTYPLGETGTKILTVRGDWSDGGSQNVSTTLSIKLEKLKCDDTTTTTKHDDTTTTTKHDDTTTTTTIGGDSTTTTGGDTTTTTIGGDSTTTTTGGDTTTTTGGDTTTTTEGTTTTTIVGFDSTSTVPDEVGGITVTTSNSSDGSGVLPFTGVERGKLIALGASALVLGLLLVAGARREET